MRAFEERDRRKDAASSYERPASLPDEMHDRLRIDAAAWRQWERERPSFRRQAEHWVASARRPETRERRFGQLLEALRRETRPQPFLVTRAERTDADR
jgi:uncharacterized protein YdeI (YjbR/CyaY-like superfamily)